MAAIIPAIEGSWQMIRAEYDGEKAPEVVARRTELELKNGAYFVRFHGETTDCGTYKLGGTATTATITLIGESGPNTGRVIPCIYQLAGDRLRICYGLDEHAPVAFSTGLHEKRYLAAYRRKRT